MTSISYPPNQALEPHDGPSRLLLLQKSRQSVVWLIYYVRRMKIQELSIADLQEYRLLRLRGLKEHPEAFGSSYAEESVRPVDAFIERLKPSSSRWAYGGFIEGDLVATVTLLLDSGLKQSHKASIVGMYVRLDQSGKGLGRRLLSHVVEAAVSLGVKQIRLSVTEVNQRALRLYEKSGFTVYGRESDALYVEGKFLAELHLAKTLSPDA